MRVQKSRRIQPIVAADWIAHHADNAPGREAVYDIASDRRFTYARFDDRITRLALFLRSLDIGAGDRVAVLSHNDSDVFEIQFACQRLGAVFVPLNWRLAVPELEFICNDAAPKVLFHGVEFAAEAGEVARLAKVPHAIDMANGGTSAYEAGIAAAAGNLPPRANLLSDVWTVMYTSGTTGRPKGAMITYEMCLYNSVHCDIGVGLSPQSNNLVFLPTFHTAGLNIFANPAFHLGARNVIMRAFDPDAFCRVLSDKDIGITHALGVPTNFLMLAEAAGLLLVSLFHGFLVLGSGSMPYLSPLVQRLLFETVGHAVEDVDDLHARLHEVAVPVDQSAQMAGYPPSMVAEGLPLLPPYDG